VEKTSFRACVDASKKNSRFDFTCRKMKNVPPKMIITHPGINAEFVRVQFAVVVNNKTCCCVRIACISLCGCICHKHPYIHSFFPNLSHCAAAAFQSALRLLLRVNFIQINAAGRTDGCIMWILSSGAPFQFPNTARRSAGQISEWDARTQYASLSLSAFHQKRNLIFSLLLQNSLLSFLWA